MALRRNWVLNRLDVLYNFLDQVNIVEVSELSVNIYIQMDAYSQRANPSFADYKFDTPRNMGKNDLWIASLAALLGLRLLTTDADFDHLDNVFIEVQKFKEIDFSRFF